MSDNHLTGHGPYTPIKVSGTSEPLVWEGDGHSDYAALSARLKEVEEERDVQNDLRQIAEDAADEWRSRAETAEAKLAIARSFDLDALLAEAVREGVKIGAHPDYQVIANEPAAIVAAVVRVKEKRT